MNCAGSDSDRLSQPFEIGTITLVPSRLIVGVMIVLGFWIIARALQRSATNLLQARDPASRGARQSVITLMAYVIITLGFLFGLSAAGLELSNLAIIAGALSVGIGFGLQNIVSNFISGIILLFERPVRVGDVVTVDVGRDRDRAGHQCSVCGSIIDSGKPHRGCGRRRGSHRGRTTRRWLTTIPRPPKRICRSPSTCCQTIRT